MVLFQPYDGFMYRSRVSEINGTMRAFAPSGQMIQGWTWDVYTDNDGDVTGDWFYANQNGTAYEDGWLAQDGAGIILTHIAAGCIQRECILLMTNATDLKKMVSSSLDGIRQEYI